MFVRIALIAAFLSMTTGLNAQENLPDDMLGFFKAGQYVGVHQRENAGAVLTIYDSKDDWDMMVDSRKMPFSELRKKYSEAEKQAVKHIDWSEKQGHLKNNPNPMVSFHGPVGRFGKVLRVGRDYVLVEIETRRSVIPAHSIEQIYWGNGAFQLYIQPTSLGPQAAPPTSADP